MRSKSVINIILISIFLFFSFHMLNAEKGPELITDRPDVTESATVVPVKTLQIESGFDYENILRSPSQDLTLITFNSTLFRYGVSKSIELRLGIEYLGSINNNKVQMNEVKEIGTNPLYLGMKVQIAKESGWLPEIAVIPGISLPFTAYRAFQTYDVEPELVISVSHTLNDFLSLGYNLGSSYNSEDMNLFYWYSAALGAGLTDFLGAYVELNSYFPTNSQATHYFHSGIVFLPINNLQLDFSAGIGLDSYSSDFHWGFGFSWRIPD